MPIVPAIELTQVQEVRKSLQLDHRYLLLHSDWSGIIAGFSSYINLGDILTFKRNWDMSRPTDKPSVLYDHYLHKVIEHNIGA